MDAQTLFDNFTTIAEAPGGVARLRRLILDLALTGRLVPQDPSDEPARVPSANTEQESTLSGRTRGRTATGLTPPQQTGPLPEGWCWARIDDTAEYVNGLAFKNTQWKPKGVPILRIQNLTKPSASFNYAEGPFPADRMVRAGDILVSWSATLDAFVWNGSEAVLNQHIFKVIPDQRVITKSFLFYLLRHSIRTMAESEAAHGLVMKHINRGPFLSFVVRIPPLAEQERIAARVDELMALCDDLESHQTERERTRGLSLKACLNTLTTPGNDVRSAWSLLESHWGALVVDPVAARELRMAILELAVRGALTIGTRRRFAQSSSEAGVAAARRLRRADTSDGEMTLPHLWRWQPLGEVAALSYGSSSKSDDVGDVPVLRMGNLQSGSIDWHQLKYSSDAREIEKYMLRPNTVLFNRTNSPDLVGKTAIYRGERPAIFAGYLIKIETAPALDPDYANLVLNSPYARSWCRAVKVDGISQSNISAAKLKNFLVPLPPVSEQKEVVAIVDQLMTQCDHLKNSMDAEASLSARFATAATKESQLNTGPIGD